MTPEDKDLAIRTMMAEAGDAAGRVAVANVILNRVKAGRYGGRSIRDVVLAKNQFEPWSPGSGNDPRRFSKDSREYKEAEALFDAAASGVVPDLTRGATHFFAPKAQAALGRNTPKWATPQSQTTPNRIGGHSFYAPEGKSMYDPSDWDAISRSANPAGVTQPKPVTGMLPTPSAPAAPSMTPQAPKAPTGNLLGRMMGGDASRPMQSWGDVFAGAGPQSPLLFRALSYGMQPSPAGSGGPGAANAGGGPGGFPSPSAPAASTPPMSLPTPGANGEAVGGSGPQLPGILGMFQKMFTGGFNPPAGGSAGPMQLPGALGGSPGGAPNPLGALGALFKMI